MSETYQALKTAIVNMFCKDESKITLHFFKIKLLVEEARKAKCQVERSDNKIVKEKEIIGMKRRIFPFKCHGCGVVSHKKYGYQINRK